MDICPPRLVCRGTSRKVEIFQGRPRGLLWFEPRVIGIDGPSISTLRELDQSLVLEVIEVSSRQEAEDVVNRLEQRSNE